MARCELSGKAPVAKNLVSHSNIKTKSRARPNIQSKKFFSHQLARSFQFKVSASAIRNIDKAGGFDVFVVQQKNQLLSQKALRIKNRILKKTSAKKQTLKKTKKSKGQDETKN